MAKGMGWLCTAVVICCVTSVAWADDELPAVEKKIVEAWGKHKSVTAKVTAETRMDMGISVTSGKGTGTFELVRRDGKLYARTELASKFVRKIGDEEQKLDQSMLIIVDGEFGYTYSEFAGQKTARKMQISPKMTGDPKALFEFLRKSHDVKLMPEQTIDDRKTYVIEASPKAGAVIPQRKTIYHFRQDIGLMVKVVAHDDAGKPMTTMTYSDIKLNLDINPARFVFKAPEGVQVLDLSAIAP